MSRRRKTTALATEQRVWSDVETELTHAFNVMQDAGGADPDIARMAIARCVGMLAYLARVRNGEERP